MRRILSKIKFNLRILLINIYIMIFTNNKNKKVAIVSCNKWKNKVLEDIKLKYYLAKNHVKADIISWEEKNNYTKYDAIIIRSVWGFEIKSFKNWLNIVNKKVKIINSYVLINNTFSKKKQFDILDKYHILHIPTKNIKSDKNISKNIKKIWDTYYSLYDKIVIKLDISESGNNTFVLSKGKKTKNSITFDELTDKFSKQNILLLIEPFIEEVNKGEISVILFNKNVSHAIIRYSGIFTKNKSCIEIAIKDLPQEILEITNKIINLKEFKDFTYLRLDFIKHENKYLVLEIELIDPFLFLNSIKDKKRQKEVYQLFVSEIKKNL